MQGMHAYIKRFIQAQAPLVWALSGCNKRKALHTVCEHIDGLLPGPSWLNYCQELLKQKCSKEIVVMFERHEEPTVLSVSLQLDEICDDKAK